MNWLSDNSKKLWSAYDLVENILLFVDARVEGEFRWSTWHDTGIDEDGFYNHGVEDTLDFAQRASEASALLKTRFYLDSQGIGHRVNGATDTQIDLDAP